MKKIFFILTFFLGHFLIAQVGINTSVPTETLDINGKMRIRDLVLNDKVPYLLTTDSSNVIHRVDKSLYINNIEDVTVTVQPGDSIIVSNSLKFDQASVVISSKNTCSKYMISSFMTYLDVISFISGIARDVIATPQIVSIPANNYASYSPSWIIKFTNVTNCGTNGISGDGTQFNFTLKKTSEYNYQIKNNGNVVRTYDFSFLKLD